MKKKLLFIEDEVETCKIMAFYFERKGFEVIVAYDGLEGLNKAKQEQPDAIILDLMLPKLCGEEVCKAIRKDAAVGKTPIIMVTGKTDEVDMVIGRLIGADAYITKPFSTEKLLDEINRLIAGK